MRSDWKRFVVPLVALELLFLALFARSQTIATAPRVIRILHEDSSSITLGNDTTPMPKGGYPFTVNVTLEGRTDYLWDFQVAVAFDNSKLKCVNASIPKNDPNFVFYGKEIMSVNPYIGGMGNHMGYVAIGASSVYSNVYVNVSAGLLCQIEFAAIRKGTSTLEIIPTESPDYDFDTFLWDPNRHYIEGGFDSAGLSITVSAASSPPIPSFTFTPSNPKANQTVAFDASETYDPDGNVTLYVWDFGDGANETTTDSNATHTYAFNGIYYVNLTVFDNDNNFSSLVEMIQIGSIPYVSFTFTPLNPQPYLDEVTFNASETHAFEGKTIVSYVWDFGDGANETATDSNATHTYESRGLFWINLTVSDTEGLSNSMKRDIPVGTLPTALFSTDRDLYSINETVNFDASGSRAGDPDATIAFYIWDFGDYREPLVVNATLAAEKGEDPTVAQHVYIVQGGEYPVNLTVVNNFGLYDSVIQNVTVSDVQIAGLGSDNTIYVTATTVTIVVIIVAAVFLKRRQKPELARKERYRVI